MSHEPMTNFIDDRFLALALPMNLQAVLGFQSQSFFEVLLETPYTRKKVAALIIHRCGALPTLPTRERDVLLEILFLGTAKMEALTRIVSVLLNSSQLQNMTRASELTLVIDFCGTSKVINLVRDMKPQKPQVILTPPTLSQDFMSRHAKITFGYLLGLFPVEYLARLALVYPPNVLPKAAPLPHGSGDRVLLLDYCATALKLLSEVDSLNAEN